MISELRRKLRLLLRSVDSGAVSVELALVVTPLFVIVAGVADFGTIMHHGSALQAATRAAAQYARNSPECVAGGVANPTCISGINSLLTSIKTTDSSLSSASFDTPVGYCTCADGVTVVDCSTGTCSVAGDTRVIQYVQITANMTVTPLIPLFSPTLPTARTTIRVQ